ncbi:electron transfer flavoprotein subunit alpha/FixB family protein [Halalkaliarchaeum sp. AArc-GB]|uniref:electron transfer flavoprotein subunit alpha/FixB family protein n=1 Tax=Halalkaliarchaeum sp. AArc-GB TaxID=3074078 RepID=UPI0028627BF6|nr:electron transfer flavoprotein subunit alpha/FixB family protein [Halalkaliarchaeum sp. AArc-GB]MDR5672052.1 electron transfer flavoprotein subunit alpha/FixB family protein [Halalkaliarchaeum sp. AArc-GB]
MVLTLVEHDAGAVDDVSLETVTFARDVATQEDEQLVAAAFGDGAGDVAEDLSAYGVDQVCAIEHDLLDAYAPEGYAKSLAQLVEELSAGTVVAPGSDCGHEVLAHLATQLDVPLATSCTEVEAGDVYGVTRQRWGGSLIEHAELEADVKLLTVVPHEVSAEPADAAADTAVEPFAPDLDDEDVAVRVVRQEESDMEGIPLSEARVVIGGGRGVGSAEDFDQLEELADLLTGTVGATRAAVNEGWRPHDDQIGQTGAKIAPEVYITAGISGAVQHWVGCKGSENVIAINTDPEAAIMQKADYAVVADLHEVVPRLIEELEE